MGHYFVMNDALLTVYNYLQELPINCRPYSIIHVSRLDGQYLLGLGRCLLYCSVLNGEGTRSQDYLPSGMPMASNCITTMSSQNSMQAFFFLEKITYCLVSRVLRPFTFIDPCLLEMYLIHVNTSVQ